MSKKMFSSSEAHFTETGSATVKCGWVEKYSVGRGFFPVRNWKKRWLMVTHQGLNYSTDQGTPAQGRTYVPFVNSAKGRKSPPPGGAITSSNNQPVALCHGNGNSLATSLVLAGKERNKISSEQVSMNPVFLFPVVTATIHPEATDGNCFYFGLRFEETETPRILLLRASTRDDREGWVRFIGQFVHAASLNGVPNLHPALMKPPKVPDPEELDSRSKNELQKSVMGWDDGFQYRAFGAEAPCENMHEEPLNWDSETETNGLTSPRESHNSGASKGLQGPPSVGQFGRRNSSVQRLQQPASGTRSSSPLKAPADFDDCL